jgi:threonine aldolase
MSTDQDRKKSAYDTAADLRDDLEAIADSDLPFSRDANLILQELDNKDSDKSTDL